MAQGVQFSGIESLRADLSAFAFELTPDIAAPSLNKGVNVCKTFSVKTTATAKKVTQKIIRPKWSIRGAKRSPPKLSADLLFTSRPIPWIRMTSFKSNDFFNVTSNVRSRGGVSAGATRNEPRGFVARMPSGYTSSFVRREQGKQRGRSNPYKGQRAGALKGRTEIDEITQTLEPEGQKSTEASVPIGTFEYEKEATRLLDLRLRGLRK